MQSEDLLDCKANQSFDGWGTTWDDLDKTRYYSSLVVSTVLIRTLVYPIMVAKTRVQHLGGDVAKLGTVSILRRVIESEGLKRLYSGFLLSTMNGLIAGPTWVTVLEQGRKLYLEEMRFSPKVSSSMAAFTATLSTQTLFVPVDNITQRLMVDQKTLAEGNPGKVVTQSSTLEVIQNIYSKAGLRGFYKGYGISLLVMGPTSMIFWPTYTTLRIWGNELSHGDERLNYMLTPCFSAVSGALAMGCTTPMDAVKTRMQLTALGTRHSTVSTAKELLRAEGVGGFFLGFRMRCSQGALLYPIFLSSYEMVKYYSRKN